MPAEHNPRRGSEAGYVILCARKWALTKRPPTLYWRHGSALNGNIPEGVDGLVFEMYREVSRLAFL